VSLASFRQLQAQPGRLYQHIAFRSEKRARNAAGWERFFKKVTANEQSSFGRGECRSSAPKRRSLGQRSSNSVIFRGWMQSSVISFFGSE
jgi:hypothetical protein